MSTYGTLLLLIKSQWQTLMEPSGPVWQSSTGRKLGWSINRINGYNTLILRNYTVALSTLPIRRNRNVIFLKSVLAKTESDQLGAVDQTNNQQKKTLMKYRQFTTRSLSHLKSTASCNFKLKDKMIMLGKPLVYC